MSEYNCTFQYATGNGVVLEDTRLITRSMATKMWNEYLPTFLEHLEQGKEPEMAVWVDMKSESDFHTTEMHYCADDFIIHDGELFERVTITPLQNNEDR